MESDGPNRTKCQRKMSLGSGCAWNQATGSLRRLASSRSNRLCQSFTHLITCQDDEDEGGNELRIMQSTWNSYLLIQHPWKPRKRKKHRTTNGELRRKKKEERRKKEEGINSKSMAAPTCETCETCDMAIFFIFDFLESFTVPHVFASFSSQILQHNTRGNDCFDAHFVCHFGHMSVNANTSLIPARPMLEIEIERIPPPLIHSFIIHSFITIHASLSIIHASPFIIHHDSDVEWPSPHVALESLL
jgi:hypothetical protein